MTITATTNATGLNQAISDYIRYSKKTPQDVLTRTAGKLGFAMFTRLRALKPEKGKVTSERLAGLKTGVGVIVRKSIRDKIFQKFGAHTDIATKKLRLIKGKAQESVSSLVVKGKRLNLQALAVARELSTRESGSGYLSVGARLAGIERLAPGKAEAFFGRYRQKLADASLKISTDGGQIAIQLGNDGVDLGKGITKPKALHAVETAISDVREDMLVYIRRKQSEAANRAGLQTR